MLGVLGGLFRSMNKKPEKNTKPHNLSEIQIKMFEEIFDISAEPLEMIQQRYRDASIHYWHPETKWIYSLCLGKWRSNSYNYLLSIAETEIDSATVDTLYQSKREALCEKNSVKTECVRVIDKPNYYYKLSTRPTQQFCIYCKESWSDKMISSGFFDCTCGDCNCSW